MNSAPDMTGHDDPGETLVARVVEFVRVARDNGFLAGVGESLDAVRVLQHCGLERQRLRWGLRALLCAGAEDWRRFDDLFDAYWLERAHRRSSRVQPAAGMPVSGTDGQRRGADLGMPAEVDRAGPGEGGDAGAGGTRGGASAQASTARSDFRFLTEPGEMEKVERLVQGLASRMRRLYRRRRRLASQGTRLHLRHTLRHSLSYGGVPLDPVYSQRRRRLPRLILLLDVSRSMSLYSYFFLRFARGLVGAFSDVHVFAFHTHLVSITDALRERDMHKLKGKLAVISMGWAGGTRIGASLQTFNQQFSRRLVNRRAVVVVVSDGLDTGPPALLAEQLKAIKQRARRLVWLNPLLGRDGYQPLAGGMAAALPLLDMFAPAHSVESLAALEPQLVRL